MLRRSWCRRSGFNGMASPRGFHSAAITRRSGELITWGCGRFGQCLRVEETSSPHQDDTKEGVSTVGRWRPPDGCKLVQVACGRRHTVVLDEHGRVWTVGDNKYGQLGRVSGRGRDLSMIEPQLVNGPLGQVAFSATPVTDPPTSPVRPAPTARRASAAPGRPLRRRRWTRGSARRSCGPGS